MIVCNMNELTPRHNSGFQVASLTVELIPACMFPRVEMTIYLLHLCMAQDRGVW
jgi:RAB protein geranylgeranyltransferase component A